MSLVHLVNDAVSISLPFQVLLSIAAIVSLALGFFQDFGTQRSSDEPPVDWVEGVAIVVAIVIVVRSLVKRLTSV